MDRSYHIEEWLCESKNGNPEECEDSVVFSDDYVAVVDGATSKSEARFRGKRGGRIAAEFISDSLKQGLIDCSVDGRTAVDSIQSALCEYSRDNKLEEQGVHLCASAVIYCAQRRQIWSVGDCQFMINGVLHTFPKTIDTILSETRSLAVHMLLASGAREEDLLERDDARGMIMDLLKKQKYLENSRDEYGFSVFSSTGTVRSVSITDVPPGAEIVLASDGYPELRDTLRQSEERLEEILRSDPLCYKQFKSTKGIAKGCSYFDDRSYIRFSLK